MTTAAPTRKRSEADAPSAARHKRGLTMPQLNAIDLPASGKTDKGTAEVLNLSRTCELMPRTCAR